jgi:hypothetical protein
MKVNNEGIILEKIRSSTVLMVKSSVTVISTVGGKLVLQNFYLFLGGWIFLKLTSTIDVTASLQRISRKKIYQIEFKFLRNGGVWFRRFQKFPGDWYVQLPTSLW